MLRDPLCPTGGSFRHFLWQVCKELQSSSLSLLLLCPSSAVNKNKVSCPRPGQLWGSGPRLGVCRHRPCVLSLHQQEGSGSGV